MNVWIITVNFGNTASTNSLINSLSVFKNLNSIVVGIADNASTISSLSKLEKIKKETQLEISLFSFKDNLYYWPAAKKVIANLKKEIGSYPDWVIICNNDITFFDDCFFEELSNIDLKKYPIVGPNVINEKGNQLNPFMIHPQSKIEKIYWTIYFISYPLSIMMLKIKKLLNPLYKRRAFEILNKKKQVYAVHGSIILFSNHYFKKGGWFDDNFDMYGEELTVAKTAKNLNIPITFFPQLNVIHHEHKSTSEINRRLLFNKAKRSHKYFQSINKK